MLYSSLLAIVISSASAKAIVVPKNVDIPVQCKAPYYTPAGAESLSTSSSSSSVSAASSSAISSRFPSVFNSCPSNLPISCTNTTVIEDSCCYEYPGGVMLQTQFWDSNPSTGPNDSWTIHGLWPDNCDGTYGSYCDSTMEIDSMKSVLESFDQNNLLEYMNTYWKNEGGDDDDLWTHEFNKHATCMSTLKPACFNQADYVENYVAVEFVKQVTMMFSNLPSYKWLADAGIVPSNNVTYAKKDIANALNSKFGAEVYFDCDKNGAIDEIWYYYHVQGRVVNGTYYPIDTIGQGSCPDQISYPIKDNYSTSSSTTSSSSATPSASIAYKGTLSPKGKTGCLLSDGSWSANNTCATFAIENAPFGGYDVKSSKGYCNFVNGQFTCDSTQSATQFALNGNNDLTFGGVSTWSAASIPASNQKVKIYADSTKAVTFELSFASK